MNFPSVKSLGGFKIYYIQNLEKVSLESLTEVGLRGFCIDASDKIQELNLPALTRVKGDFVFNQNGNNRGKLIESIEGSGWKI